MLQKRHLASDPNLRFGLLLKRYVDGPARCTSLPVLRCSFTRLLVVAFRPFNNGVSSSDDGAVSVQDARIIGDVER